jgi:hypothetical protein
MGYVKAKIANCRRASIRKTPWIPLRREDIVGLKDGPSKDEETIIEGSTIEIDTEATCYDWTDRRFYKVKDPEGWIYEGCVSLGGDGG